MLILRIGNVLEDLSPTLADTLQRARNDSIFLFVTQIAKHCVGLATGCLPICKDCSILALQQLLNVVLSNSVVHLFLCGKLTADSIEAELIATIVHHRFVILEG